MWHSIVFMLHPIVFVLHCIVFRLHSIVFMSHSIVFMLQSIALFMLYLIDIIYVTFNCVYITFLWDVMQLNGNVMHDEKYNWLERRESVGRERKRWRMCSHSWRETSDLTASTGSPGTAKSNLTVISYHDLISQNSPALNLKSSLFNPWGVKSNIKSNCAVHVCNEFKNLFSQK